MEYTSLFHKHDAMRSVHTYTLAHTHRHCSVEYTSLFHKHDAMRSVHTYTQTHMSLKWHSGSKWMQHVDVGHVIRWRRKV